MISRFFKQGAKAAPEIFFLGLNLGLQVGFQILTSRYDINETFKDILKLSNFHADNMDNMQKKSLS